MSQYSSAINIKLKNKNDWERFKELDLAFLENCGLNPQEDFCSEPWMNFSMEELSFSEENLYKFAKLLIDAFNGEVIFVGDSIDLNSDPVYSVYYYIGDGMRIIDVYPEDEDDDGSEDDYVDWDEEGEYCDYDSDEFDWPDEYEDDEELSKFDSYEITNKHSLSDWLNQIADFILFSPKECDFLKKFGFDIEIN